MRRRQALDLPDGRVENTYENRLKIVRVLRELRPRVVILPYWQGRHPDHYTTAILGYEACFLSGLARLETGAAPHRPYKVLYASLYADVRPTFVVDITPFPSKSAIGRLWPTAPSTPMPSREARSLCLRRRFASARSRRRDTMANWLECGTQSHSCKRRSVWWTT